MSRAARWVLGAFALLFAAMFASTASNSPRPLAVWICTAFCVLIALSCFSSVARGPAIRIIGAVVFLLYVGYLILEIRKGLWRPYEGRASEHWWNALEGLIAFGMPGLYVAIRGQYPIWGRGAKAFRGEQEVPKEGSDPSSASSVPGQRP